jgi:hypothetical protein
MTFLAGAGFAAVAKVEGDCLGKVGCGTVFISSIVSPTGNIYPNKFLWQAGRRKRKIISAVQIIVSNGFRTRDYPRLDVL